MAIFIANETGNGSRNLPVPEYGVKRMSEKAVFFWDILDYWYYEYYSSVSYCEKEFWKDWVRVNVRDTLRSRC